MRKLIASRGTLRLFQTEIGFWIANGMVETYLGVLVEVWPTGSILQLKTDFEREPNKWALNAGLVGDSEPHDYYMRGVCARCWGVKKGMVQKVRFNRLPADKAGETKLHPHQLLCRDCWGREMFARKRVSMPVIGWSVFQRGVLPRIHG